MTTPVQSDADELLRAVQGVKSLGVDSVLQGEILVHLMARRWTGAELVAQIAATRNDEARSGGADPLRAEYMRILRALATLERKGYVTKALFGREKPYRLTEYGKEMVTAAMQGTQPTVLSPRRDFLAYTAAAAITALTVVMLRMRLAPEILMACWLATGLSLGLSLSRFWRILRRVM